MTLVLALAPMSAGCGQVKDMLGLSSTPKRTSTATVTDKAAGGADDAAAPGARGRASTRTPAGPKASTPAQRRAARPGAETAVPAPATLDGTPTSQALVAAPTVANGTQPLPDTRGATSAGRGRPSAPQPVVTGSSWGDGGSPVYSSADADVTPARLLTPQDTGPVFRGAPGAKNTMELIISKLGRVEQVRLTSPSRRMTDMLLLSGAKTWKFAPAMKDGEPVRYRTSVSWETTP